MKNVLPKRPNVYFGSAKSSKRVSSGEGEREEKSAAQKRAIFRAKYLINLRYLSCIM